MDTYIDVAWTADQEVPGSRSVLITLQATLVQRMMKQVLMISLSQQGVAAALRVTINGFDGSHRDLLNGNGGSGKFAIPKTTADVHLEALATSRGIGVL